MEKVNVAVILRPVFERYLVQITTALQDILDELLLGFPQSIQVFARRIQYKQVFQICTYSPFVIKLSYNSMLYEPFS
jgi:hypothetical protein